MSYDLAHLYQAQDQTARWRAERENASARLELAQRNERAALLISQHEPVASLGLDREHLRFVLGYLQHGDMNRLGRDLATLVGSESETRLSTAERKRAEVEADLQRMIERHGLTLSELALAREDCDALRALLDGARNWVQDPELRTRIDAICPPKPRPLEDQP